MKRDFQRDMESINDQFQKSLSQVPPRPSWCYNIDGWTTQVLLLSFSTRPILIRVVLIIFENVGFDLAKVQMSIWFNQLICTFSWLSMLSQVNKATCCCIKHLQELFLYNGSMILLPRRIPLHKMLLRRTSPSWTVAISLNV